MESSSVLECPPLLVSYAGTAAGEREPVVAAGVPAVRCHVDRRAARIDRAFVRTTLDGRT
jgi:hypothetical protein